ncbi:hypothetical protein DM01DRAFT_1341121 [Hesseltinella vesiculosa]|uniref:Protein AF-9 homolog n=1 Tax=Hesseltinella vesiculosa TaxID=101127 RepID=A0A1X2G210_9FUNG|nr:hypothetical protein DM01DRAFT_1341121 [Hesseltinella vesiculosa]
MNNGKEQKGKLSQLLDHVEYILHPTFVNPRRAVHNEPYTIQEKGWGEFDMRIALYFVDNVVPPEVIVFDLNFRSSNFSVIHKRVFPDPPPRFVSLLYQPVSTTSTSNNKRPSPKLPHQQTAGPSSSTSPQSPLSQLDIPTDASSRDDKPNIGTTKRTRFGRHPPSQQAHLDTTKSPAKRRELKDGTFIDDIYSETDLSAIHPIHRTKLEPATKRAWGIPLDVDIVELARRLSAMNDDQVDEFQTIVRNALTKDMTVEDLEDEIVVDLYSLGPELLNTLWQFTNRLMDPSLASTDPDAMEF